MLYLTVLLRRGPGLVLVLPGLVRGDALGCGAGPFRWTVLWLKNLSSELRFLCALAARQLCRSLVVFHSDETRDVMD